MNGACEIRPIGPDEPNHVEACRVLLRGLAALHAELEPDAMAPIRDGSAPLRRLQAALSMPRRALVLAALDDSEEAPRVVGVAVLHLEEGDGPTPQRPTAVMTDLMVAACSRRRGHGRALLAAAQRWAGAIGAERLVVNVRESNADALRFYVAAGCRAVSRWMSLPAGMSAPVGSDSEF